MQSHVFFGYIIVLLVINSADRAKQISKLIDSGDISKMQLSFVVTVMQELSFLAGTLFFIHFDRSVCKC